MPATRRRSVALVATLLLAPACGSTVAQQGSTLQAAGGVNAPAADGLSVAGTTGGGTSSMASGAVGAPGAATSANGSAAAGPAAGGTTTTGGGAGAPAAGSAPGGRATSTGSSGPGVTAKEIYVGFIHDENAGAVNQAAGIGAITSGDSKANQTAILKDINAHGGVAGRKLVAVYASFDSTSSQTIDEQYAAICEKFTRDQPRVFAALGAGTDSYRACMTKAGVTLLSDDLPSVGAADLRRYPAFIEQGYANIDRLAAFHATPLAQQNYFSPWNAQTGAPAPTGKAKVGIYTYNDKVFSTAVDRYLVPALKKLGYDPQVAKIAQVNTASDYSSQAAAVKSAQLAFAANGVTHVIPFEGNGGLSVFFLANARSQGYYPRYGISTASGFQALLDAGIPDKKQMNGAVGFGWMPSVDLPASYTRNDANPYYNPNARHCMKVMKDAGITFDSTNAKQIALSECAALYLLQVSLAKTPAQITASSFIGAVEGLGTSYQKAGGLGQQFAPGRHDPSNKAYRWGYYENCGCFHYSGSLLTIP